MVIDMSLDDLVSEQSSTWRSHDLTAEAPPWLTELAKKSGCQMVSSEVFLLEEAEII